MDKDKPLQVLVLGAGSATQEFAQALRKVGRAVAVNLVAQNTLIAETFPLKARDLLITPVGWTKPQLGKVNGKRKRNPDRWR